jgi:hypothetical protein
MSIKKNEQFKIEKLKKLRRPIFFEPSNLIPYDYLIPGIKMKNNYIGVLAGNTYRGFHKIVKDLPGAGKIFPEYFLKKSNKDFILQKLKSLKTTELLEILSNKISNGIRRKLAVNITGDQLLSYNKVRKPVDIVIEMIVCLSSEIIHNDRKKLIPLLRLPLDSWMFKEKLVFGDDALRELEINRRFTFQNIRTKKHYLNLQNHIKDRCNLIGRGIYPICLDLLWNNRYKGIGKNIAELNFV